MTAPISLDEARRKQRKGGNGTVEASDAPCPLVPLGHRDGEFVFLDIKGQERRLKARALSSRGDLVSLFVGNTAWLFQRFPVKSVKVETVDGVKVVSEEVTGFSTAQASEALMALCGEAGLYGPHVVLRGPGVWRGDDGAPIVHSGSLVLDRGEWRRSGYRAGDQVWVSAPQQPRPGVDGPDGVARTPGALGFAAPAAIAQKIQDDIRRYWKFRHDGSEIVCIGLMAIGYYGAAARWRSNGYLLGGTGSGKSMLLELLRCCVPVHSFSTDTSKAGIEGAINGQPTIVFLDEAGDRADQHGAQQLLDMVLSASGAGGTRGLRGSVDGKSRSFSVICNVIMAAKNPPDMQAQHRDRFTMVEMIKPSAGSDNRAQMEAAAQFAKQHSRALWGRAIEGWPRWLAGLDVFRAALGRAQCATREMDQVGAILASWWVMTRDGVPVASDADAAVGDIQAYVRSADEIARDDGPRRLLQFLAGTIVQRDRSTDVEQLGVLVEQGFSPDSLVRDPARRLLARYGIRVVLESEAMDKQGRLYPRGDLGDGLWFSRSAETLRALFKGSPFQGDRWMYEMARLDSAVEWKAKNVRIGGVSGPAIWISRTDWSPPDDDQTL